MIETKTEKQLQFLLLLVVLHRCVVFSLFLFQILAKFFSNGEEKSLMYYEISKFKYNSKLCADAFKNYVAGEIQLPLLRFGDELSLK